MQDALLIYCMLAAMRHAGYARYAASVLQSARAKRGSMRLAAVRSWEMVAAAVRQTRRPPQACAVATARLCCGTVLNPPNPRGWLAALMRLDSYVASMT